ncbi:efflux transporter outer membrane subunit [Pseudomonas sp. MWU12-2345]|uniref:efflux transporter outer membrane subunit n=1 Tax=Pseudomonas sp. MWU12-2345 TaxID=2928689 RepID=UPI002010643D|nr:efflux transporter outer membrane subunit [Pseudomonas sp. MWU12-2345]
MDQSRVFRPMRPCGRWLVLSLLTLTSACTLGPDFSRPAAPAQEGYIRDPISATVAAQGQAQRFLPGAEVAPDWWRLFQSASLDAVVHQAIANNMTLRAAEASLRQSQDTLMAGYGVFYPHLDVHAGADRERSAPIQQGLGTKGSIFNVVTLSGTISYTLDIFGGERRTVEGLQAQVDHQAWLTQAAYLTLTANVVNAAIARAAYAAQIQATEQLIELQKQQLQTTQVQVRSGTTPYSAILSLQSLIASNEALLPALRQKVSQAEHLLATLEGVVPSEVKLPDIQLSGLSLPKDLPVSLPSVLVRQRPDILSAEAQLHQASAAIGVATAAMFPSFSLTGTYGTAGSSPGSLFAGAGRFWSVGPSIDIPLFQGGSLWFGRKAAIDAYQQAAAGYREVVLESFAQVADTLKALEFDAQALQKQAEAQAASAEALRLLQANYRSGLVTYLDLLAADVQLHQVNIAYLQALAQRHQDTVGLFVALGGGWWNRVDATGSRPGP